MGTFIVSLRDVRENDVERCGGKATGLGRLARMGAAVPPGFCIAAEALPYVLDAEGLTGQIEELARKIDFHDLANVEAGCEEIFVLVASGGISETLSPPRHL